MQISAFVVRCLDSIIPLVSISEMANLYLASVAAQAGLCLTWSQILKTGFLVTWLISHKRDLGKQCRPRYDAIECASVQSQHCLHTEFSTPNSTLMKKWTCR